MTGPAPLDGDTLTPEQITEIGPLAEADVAHRCAQFQLHSAREQRLLDGHA